LVVEELNWNVGLKASLLVGIRQTAVVASSGMDLAS
jgi:hypothetical protein